MTNDDLYIAWLNAGADCAGLKFSDFIKHLPPRQPEQAQPVAWVDAVMEQAQVFASAWSLVGSRFDNGSGMEDAEQAKAELRALLTAPPPSQPLTVEQKGGPPRTFRLPEEQEFIDTMWRMEKKSTIGLTPEEIRDRNERADAVLDDIFSAREIKISLPSPPPRQPEPLTDDTKRLNAMVENSWDLRCFDMPTGQGDADIGWRVIEHHMAKPHERVVAEVFNDDPRKAIDAAIEAAPRIKRQA